MGLIPAFNTLDNYTTKKTASEISPRHLESQTKRKERDDVDIHGHQAN
jgi:hypothetical protein